MTAIARPHAIRAPLQNAADRTVDDVVGRLGLIAVALAPTALVLVFDPRIHEAFSLPKSLAGHVTAFALAALLVIHVRRSGRRAMPRSALHVAVATYLLANALAVMTAVDPFFALFGTPDHYVGLTSILEGAVLYAATASFVRWEPDVRAVAIAMLATAVPVIGYAAIQSRGLDPIAWREAPLQVFSTLGNATVLGGYLGLVVALALGALICFWDDWKLATRAAIIVVAVASLVLLLYATTTRAAVLGLGLGVTVILTAAARHRVLPRGRAWAFVGLVGSVILGGALALSPLGTRLGALVGVGDTSAVERLAIWRSALQVVAERPLLGAGPDGFELEYPRLRPVEVSRIGGQVDVLSHSAHSLFLRVATNAGAAGLAAYAAVLATAGWAAWRARTRAAALGSILLATYVGMAAVTVEHLGIEWIPWLALGLIACGAHADAAATLWTAPATPRTRRGRGRARPPWGAALDVTAVAVALLASAMAVRPLAPAMALADSTRKLEAGDPRGAVGAALEAATLDPYRSSYWRGLGVAYSAAGRPREAEEAFSRAVSTFPYSSDGWRNLAVARLQLVGAGASSMRAGALEAARNAIVAEPNNPYAHYVLARVAVELGDNPLALQESEQAIAIAPQLITLYEVPAVVYMKMGRWDDAEKAIVPRVGDSLAMRLLAVQLYLATGRPALAVEQLKEYLKVNYADQEARALLRRLEPPQ